MSTRRLSDTSQSLTPDGSSLRGGIAAGHAVVDWRLRTDPGLLPPRRGARGGSQLAGGGVSVGEEGWEGCQACTRPSVAHTCSVHARVHADQPIRNRFEPCRHILVRRVRERESRAALSPYPSYLSQQRHSRALILEPPERLHLPAELVPRGTSSCRRRGRDGISLAASSCLTSFLVPLVSSTGYRRKSPLGSPPYFVMRTPRASRGSLRSRLECQGILAPRWGHIFCFSDPFPIHVQFPKALRSMIPTDPYTGLEFIRGGGSPSHYQS
jgi:hypothetical protein